MDASSTIIRLSNGGEAIVDSADYQSPKLLHSGRFAGISICIAERTWRLREHHHSSRVVTTVKRRGVQAEIAIHRLIAEATDEQLIDHVDGDPCNNRRRNLRLATTAQNVRNRRRHSSKRSSQFKGVYLHPRSGWFAAICKDYRKKHLGYFPTEEEAALAYNESAIRLFGEFARLNVIEEASIS